MFWEHCSQPAQQEVIYLPWPNCYTLACFVHHEKSCGKNLNSVDGWTQSEKVLALPVLRSLNWIPDIDSPSMSLISSAWLLTSCCFITVMHTCLKVPAKNSPALLFLSRGKEEERKTTISCFAPAEEEQSRGILGGKFQMRTHDGNKAAAHKVMGCFVLTIWRFM